MYFQAGKVGPYLLSKKNVRFFGRISAQKIEQVTMNDKR